MTGPAPQATSTLLATPSARTRGRDARWTLYALAILITTATLLARLAMSSWVGDRPVLVLFLIPIIVSAYAGGLGPGLTSTLIVALGTSYFLLAPGRVFFIGKPLDFAQWTILVGTGVLVSILNEQLRRAHRRDASTIDQLRAAQALLKDSMAALAELNATLEQRVAQRTAELEAANQELEAFSYSVSHDLRAPLRAMDGFSQALLEDVGPQLPEQGRRHAQIIRDAAQRMGRLIDDLLAFSRLSRQPLHAGTVDTARIVREVLDELQSREHERQIEVRVGELQPCHGDHALLKQVWINLLSNALKYTRRRDPAIVEIGGYLQQQEQVYFVRDNGAGFEMKYAGKLFGVFQRLHRAEEFDGTGVGLAIAQRIVHRHEGRIWAEAALDRGATFYFSLQRRTKA